MSGRLGKMVEVRIRELGAEHLGSTITIRGVISRVRTHGDSVLFRMYEVVNDGTIPRTITCKGRQTDGIKEGNCIKAEGVLKEHMKRHTQAMDMYFAFSGIEIVDEEELRPAPGSWFTNANLDQLRTSTGDELVKLLNSKAAQEGFQLVRDKSFNDGHCMLRCYLHSNGKKKEELNCNCMFRIGIGVFGTGNGEKSWHITRTRFLVHSHPLDPSLFSHLSVPQEILLLIQALRKHGVPIGKILDIIRDDYSSRLTSQQLRVVISKSTEESDMSESEALIAYVRASGGVTYSLEYEDELAIHRRAVACFSKRELEFLSLFGDFISVDPTFTNMSSGWNLIPVTLIGRNREILSGGIVMCNSVTSEVFEWLLRLLCEVLPCKERVVTICSDDDVALQAAFDHYSAVPEPDEVTEKVKNLCRVICFWHKCYTFSQFLQRKIKGKEARESAMKLFRLMGTTRDRDLCLSLLARLEENESVKKYLDSHVRPKLHEICKSFLTDKLTLGYNTSSMAEASNSRLKRSLGQCRATLTDIRQVLDSCEERAADEHAYVKRRKPHLLKSQEFAHLVETFHVETRICEALISSRQKGDSTTGREAGEVYTVEETIRLGAETFTEHFHVTATGKCSCGKLENVGIPCSHLFSYWKHLGIPDPYLMCQILPRWQFNDESPDILPSPISPVFVLPSTCSTVQRLTVKARYNVLASQCAAIIKIGAGSEQQFELAKGILDELQQKLENPKPALDDRALRPGRPHVHRIRTSRH